MLHSRATPVHACSGWMSDIDANAAAQGLTANRADLKTIEHSTERGVRSRSPDPGQALWGSRLRHCERSEANPESFRGGSLDRFAALAMTRMMQLRAKLRSRAPDAARRYFSGALRPGPMQQRSAGPLGPGSAQQRKNAAARPGHVRPYRYRDSSALNCPYTASSIWLRVMPMSRRARSSSSFRVLTAERRSRRSNSAVTRSARAPKNPLDEGGRKGRPAVCEIMVILLLRPIVPRGEAGAVGADARGACTPFCRRIALALLGSIAELDGT
nr:hypothetical protein BDOA9_0157070 [Bradyrhizobium sp. DOA9]